MKPLTKKVLESGLVDKHVAKMFEKWGQLEPGATELAGQHQITKETLEQFACEIEDLLDQKQELHETRLEVRVKPPITLYSSTTGVFSASEDELGRLIIDPSIVLIPGDRIFYTQQSLSDMGAAFWMVLEVEPLYQNETMIAYQVTVDKSES